MRIPYFSQRYVLGSIVLLLILNSVQLYTKGSNRKDISAEYLLSQGAVGKEFVIAIPPNEIPSYSTNVLEIYITSAYNTTVRIESPTGLLINKVIEANKVTTLSSSTGELAWSYECRASETKTDQGIFIKATKPISVYVLNAKPATSDGYLAIPIDNFGNEYIHCSYWDFYEGSLWAGGFIVVAAEDNTSVFIDLWGSGAATAKTAGGRKISDRNLPNYGESITVNLNAGQTYMVCGDGKTRGRFDLSGTYIKSSKPVGLISFHHRCIIPHTVTNGRDHLSEMLPPIQAWGKKYCTVEFMRTANGGYPVPNMGDFFRVISSQPNTNWKVKWYNKNTGALVGQQNGTLKNRGDFQEISSLLPESNAIHAPSVNGTSVWEADKPFLVMQYSYSAYWDGNELFDPFMVLVVPVEQYIPATVFQTPANKSFNANWFNIIAVGDPEDYYRNDSLLKSIQVDDNPIWLTDASFVSNRIPNTNLYWSKIGLEPGPHRIKGDTKFGGYIYGFSSYDSYGWPAAMAINNVSELDTLAPEYFPDEECGNYTILTTEVRDGATTDDPRQIDLGILTIDLLEGSYNYELEFPEKFVTKPKLSKYTFKINLIDPKKDAKAIYAITDQAGNISIDSVFYKVASFSINPSEIHFGNVRINTTKTMNVTLNNTTDTTVLVKEIKLQKNQLYKIISGGAPPEFNMLPKEERIIEIAYTPTKEGLKEADKDYDSLLLVTDCINFSWVIDGRGVQPKILVEDWNAGAVQVNKTVCKESQGSSGLSIQNIGTDTLHITEIKFVTEPFTLSNPTIPALPIIIPPGGLVQLRSCCFSPTETKDYKIVVKFVCDATIIKDTSIWQGIGIQPGPVMTNMNWEYKRVGTKNLGVVYLRNYGNSSFWVKGFNLENSSINDFKIISTNPTVNLTNPVELFTDKAADGKLKEIAINVEFSPETETTLHNEVVPVFADTNIKCNYGLLDGIGILPHIEVIGYDFQPSILINTKHPNTGYVTIKSTSQTADLFVESISFENNEGDFSWVYTPKTDFILQKGDTAHIDVEFTPKKVLDRITKVNVVSDAIKGDSTNRTTTTVDVTGHAYETGIENDSLNFGSVITCNNPISKFFIRNTSSTTKAVVDSIVLESGDINNYRIITTFPQEIDPKGNLPVEVEFLPVTEKSYYCKARIYSNSDNIEHYAALTGVGFVVNVNYNMRKYTKAEQLIPGTNITMDIDIKSDNWNDAMISAITLNIIYDQKWMRFLDKIDFGQDFSNWTLDGNPEVSSINDPALPNYVKLTIKAKGSPVTKNGLFIKPWFLTLLSYTNQFEPYIDINTIDYSDRTRCIVNTQEPGLVTLNSCVIDIRSIAVSNSAYYLQEIQPNPITKDNLNISFGIGLNDKTKIEIVNSNGEIVSVPVNSELKAGDHIINVNIDKLSSGVYYIKIVSGPFTDIKTIVISK